MNLFEHASSKKSRCPSGGQKALGVGGLRSAIAVRSKEEKHDECAKEEVGIFWCFCGEGQTRAKP